jgi:hypothetical protein
MAVCDARACPLMVNPLSAGADTLVMKNIAQLVDHNHRFPPASVAPYVVALPRKKSS